MKQNIIHVDECECYLDGDKGIVVAPCGPSAGHEVAGIGSEMVDDGVSLDHAGRVVDNITDEYELGG